MHILPTVPTPGGNVGVLTPDGTEWPEHFTTPINGEQYNARQDEYCFQQLANASQWLKSNCLRIHSVMHNETLAVHKHDSAFSWSPHNLCQITDCPPKSEYLVVVACEVKSLQIQSVSDYVRSCSTGMAASPSRAVEIFPQVTNSLTLITTGQTGALSNLNIDLEFKSGYGGYEFHVSILSYSVLILLAEKFIPR